MNHSLNKYYGVNSLAQLLLVSCYSFPNQRKNENYNMYFIENNVKPENDKKCVSSERKQGNIRFQLLKWSLIKWQYSKTSKTNFVNLYKEPNIQTTTKTIMAKNWLLIVVRLVNSQWGRMAKAAKINKKKQSYEQS